MLCAIIAGEKFAMAIGIRIKRNMPYSDLADWSLFEESVKNWAKMQAKLSLNYPTKPKEIKEWDRVIEEETKRHVEELLDSFLMNVK